MGKLLSQLAESNKQAGEGIVREINAILALEALENEDINDNFSQAFKKLKATRNCAYTKNNSILMQLTDDDLIRLIKIFKHKSPKISEKIITETETLTELTNKENDINQKLRNSSRQISSNKFQIDILPKEPPGIWANIIADKQPGFLKSIFLSLFVSQESIDAAKKQGAAYQKRKDLLAINEGLQLTNTKQQGIASAIEERVNSQDKKVRELKMYHSVLERSINELEKHANALDPKKNSSGKTNKRSSD